MSLVAEQQVLLHFPDHTVYPVSDFGRFAEGSTYPDFTIRHGYHPLRWEEYAPEWYIAKGRSGRRYEVRPFEEYWIAYLYEGPRDRFWQADKWHESREWVEEWCAVYEGDFDPDRFVLADVVAVTYGDVRYHVDVVDYDGGSQRTYIRLGEPVMPAPEPQSAFWVDLIKAGGVVAPLGWLLS